MLRAGLFEPLQPGYVHRVGELLPGGLCYVAAVGASQRDPFGLVATGSSRRTTLSLGRGGFK